METRYPDPADALPSQLLAAIVESSDDAIISKDLNGIITSWNAAATRLFGYAPEEMIGQSVLKLIPSELQHEEPEILRKLKAGERIDHYDTKRVTKHGERIEVSLTISPVRDAIGLVVGASKIARDIRERTKAEAALLQSEKLAAVGRMAAAIAHEVNNPLEAVLNLAFLLWTDSSLNETNRERARLLLDQVVRVSEITKRTLSFYRDSPDSSNVDIASLLDDLLELNRHTVERKQLRVQKVYRGAGVVHGRVGELRQLFANLLINAFNAVPQQGKLTVKISPAHSASGHPGVRVTISDNGSGIPESVLPHIFEPFFTTSQNRGTGLGLWIGRAIVQKHGGSIRVRSRTHGDCTGTVFCVFLPREHDSSKTGTDDAGTATQAGAVRSEAL